MYAVEYLSIYKNKTKNPVLFSKCYNYHIFPQLKKVILQTLRIKENSKYQVL